MLPVARIFGQTRTVEIILKYGHLTLYVSNAVHDQMKLGNYSIIVMHLDCSLVADSAQVGQIDGKKRVEGRFRSPWICCGEGAPHGRKMKL